LRFRKRKNQIVNPPTKNAFRSKWFYLLSFVILDLFQIIIISSVHLTQTDRKIFYNLIDVGFDFNFNFDLLTTFAFIIVIYLLRSIIGNYILIQMFNSPSKGMYQIYPVVLPEEIDNRVFSNISSAKISNWVTVISEEMKIGKISKVFLAKTAIPNAYTIELSAFPYIPFLRKRNFVVLNSNILLILKDEELKSVISHELAHIKNHDSILRLILSGPHLFLQAAYLFFYVIILTGISNAIFLDFSPVKALVEAIILILIMIFATLISDLTISFLRKSNQMAELQADLEPLRIIGFKPTINMLIKLGQRTEVLESLKVETIWLEKQDIYREDVRRGLILEILEKFPETEIDDLKVKLQAPKVYLDKMIDILKDQYFLEIKDLPGLEERKSLAVERLFEKRKTELDLRSKRIKQGKKKQTIYNGPKLNWRHFDLNLDFNLDVEEIKQFVSELEKNPDMMFRSENAETKPDKNHPSFRTRILFVFQVAEEWHIVDKNE
jgi:Zn-dependent protease with chaperone function